MFDRIMPLASQSATRIGDGGAGSAGRWRLNSGSEMILAIPGINSDMPCRVVIDTQTAQASNKRIIALVEHDKDRPIGYWSDFSFSAGCIEADLYLVEPKGESEQDALEDAVRIGAMARAGVPLQVSVGAEAGESGEWVLSAGKVSCNDRDYDGDDGSGMPLVILRGAEIYEASIVTFGADDITGKLAARRITLPTKESNMDLKASLLKFPEKHRGIVATMLIEGADEATIATKLHASEIEERDSKIAAMTAEIADLKAKLEAAPKGDPKVSAAAAGADAGVKHVEASKANADDAPKTIMAAMKVISASKPDLKGLALRREAIRLYPDAARV
jgi:hypothetical protein